MADPSVDHALWSVCGHTANACTLRSRQFLMGLRVVCINMEEQLLLLKILLLEDERSDWVNPIFYERETCGEFHTLFPILLEQAQKFFQYFRMGPDTFWYILQIIRLYKKKQSNFRKCISSEERLAVTLRYVCRKILFVIYNSL
jgi:hypothetical protein